jgi:hypothetical protein
MQMRQLQEAAVYLSGRHTIENQLRLFEWQLPLTRSHYFLKIGGWPYKHFLPLPQFWTGAYLALVWFFLGGAKLLLLVLNIWTSYVSLIYIVSFWQIFQ